VEVRIVSETLQKEGSSYAIHAEGGEKETKVILGGGAHLAHRP
jgi:hypothetical protein